MNTNKKQDLIQTAAEEEGKTVDTSFHPACPHCLEGRRLGATSDKDASTRYMASHQRCVACRILIGPSHYNKDVDNEGRCSACERTGYRVPRLPREMK